jgi:hypothetical protein
VIRKTMPGCASSTAVLARWSPYPEPDWRQALDGVSKRPYRASALNRAIVPFLRFCLYILTKKYDARSR